MSGDGEKCAIVCDRERGERIGGLMSRKLGRNPSDFVGLEK